jgi:hypothetical protein
MSHSVIPLDLAGSIVTMAVIAVDLVAVTQTLSGSFARRLVIAAVGGGWVGLAVFLGATGRLAFSPHLPAPLCARLRDGTPLERLTSLWPLGWALLRRQVARCN